MDIEIKIWLYDILNAINEIESFFADSPKDFIVYQNDIRTKRAVERNIEIIGEALNRILKKESSIEFSNARKIVNTRNRIIHGYDTVSDDIIWSILINHIPILDAEIQNLLKRISGTTHNMRRLGKNCAGRTCAKQYIFNKPQNMG